MTTFRRRVLFCGLMLCAVPARVVLADNAPAESPDFKKHVLPIFEAKCNRCHGEKRRGGQLDMRTVESLLKGGVSGPAIKPGNAQKSLLIEMIHFKEMPPKKETPRVTEEELKLLKTWVDALPKPAG